MSGSEILLVSSPQYEKLTAEIFWDGKFVALINQDDGLDQLKIEFPANDLNESKILRNIELNLFFRLIELAWDKLVKS